MSSYTTLRISRRAALAKLMELRGEEAPTTVEIENELDEVLEHTLYNFLIVDHLDSDQYDDDCFMMLRKKEEGD